MISVTFTNDVENIVATEHLYQWDNGQKLSISGVGTTADIHFANKKSEKALVITPTVTSGAMEAPIPNSLLAEPYPIIAYVYVPSDDGARTLKTVTIAVEARKQPSDFVLDEDEGITTIETISQRVNEVLQNATNQVNTAISNMNADYSNFKNTIQGELADMVANTTIPNADTVDGLHANEIASNPNLLINPDFKINQRGYQIYHAYGGQPSTETEKYDADYFADGWKFIYGGETAEISDDGVILTLIGNQGVKQSLDSKLLKSLAGKTVTFSIDWELVSGNYANLYFNPTTVSSYDTGRKKQHFSYVIPDDISDTGDYNCIISGDGVIKVYSVKMEVGSIATPFVPPNHATELLKIQAMDGTIPADTLDGKHASDFALKTDIPTSLPANGGNADTANTANTANTAGTLATTPTNVCLRNISFGTADPQVTDSSAEGYVAEGALYGQYV